MHASNSVSVIARIRPVLDRERGADVSVDVDKDECSVSIKTARGMERMYKMQKALNNKDQETVFQTVLPTVESALEGYNTSILCYGQTGTGKTMTMLGYDLWLLAQSATQQQQATTASSSRRSSALSASVGSPRSSLKTPERGAGSSRSKSMGGTGSPRSRSLGGARASVVGETEAAVPPLKTLTFAEASAAAHEKHEHADVGLIPRTMEWLFIKQLHSKALNELRYSVSYLEIYNEAVHDLLAEPTVLSPAKAALQEAAYNTPLWLKLHPEAVTVNSYTTTGPKLNFKGGNAGAGGLDKSAPGLDIKTSNKGVVKVPDATVVPVSSEAEVMELLWRGAKTRAVAATDMNTYSSRSHTIFTVFIEKYNADRSMMQSSKLTFVDLAGSEKVAKYAMESMSQQQMQELACINKSLSTLTGVVNALSAAARMEKAKGKTESKNNAGDDENGVTKVHIPYRDSKLTRLLQDCIGGGARTLFIVTLSPSQLSTDETNSTLMFADRAMRVQVSARPATLKRVDKASSAVELSENDAELTERHAREIERLHGAMNFLVNAAYAHDTIDNGMGWMRDKKVDTKDVCEKLIYLLKNDEHVALRLHKELHNRDSKLEACKATLKTVEAELESQRSQFVVQCEEHLDYEAETSNEKELMAIEKKKFNAAVEEAKILRYERSELHKAREVIQQIADSQERRWAWLQEFAAGLAAREHLQEAEKSKVDALEIESRISMLEQMVALSVKENLALKTHLLKSHDKTAKHRLSSLASTPPSVENSRISTPPVVPHR